MMVAFNQLLLCANNHRKQLTRAASFHLFRQFIEVDITLFYILEMGKVG